jgi:8-oxo-dGTP pyrophosphatase MutT (NUDIX family)
MSKVIGHAVCVIIQNDDGKILGVSRKDNPNMFGLAGGKVDPEDGTDYEQAIIRECKEETGLDIYDLVEIDVRDYSRDPEKLRTQHCFTAKYKGEIASREELDSKGEFGIVKWLNKEDFNFYKEYNNWMFDKIGI